MQPYGYDATIGKNAPISAVLSLSGCNTVQKFAPLIIIT
jgi:hypothetical protein